MSYPPRLAVVARLIQVAGSTRSYRIVLGVMLATLSAASHLGGSITHGETYLTAAAPEPRQPAVVRLPLTHSSQAEVYADVIHLVFAMFGVDCHGPGKQQDGLRLDHAAGIMGGGTSGPLAIAGKPELSLLLQCLALPESDAKRMPSAGRPRPKFNDQELLGWWVGSGMPTTGLVAALTVPGPVAAILDERLLPAVAADAPKSDAVGASVTTLRRTGHRHQGGAQRRELRTWRSMPGSPAPRLLRREVPRPLRVTHGC